MPRIRKGNPVHGWINLYKPRDVTSTRAVSIIRRIFQAQKGGHAGTLDPMAEGVLPIALGEATKTVPCIQDEHKVYEFRIVWGEERDTDDEEGVVTAMHDHRPDERSVQKILPEFTGLIQQVPPRYSAIKLGGERAYDLARAGGMPELQPRQVEISALECLECNDSFACFRAVTGKGFYVRSLGRDLARALGTYGYVTGLKRLRVGPFSAENAIKLDKLEIFSNSDDLGKFLLPIQAALADIPALSLKAEEARALKNGQAVRVALPPALQSETETEGRKPVSVLAKWEGKPIALAGLYGNLIKPARVFQV